jgi:hypothetical protein
MAFSALITQIPFMAIGFLPVASCSFHELVLDRKSRYLMIDSTIVGAHTIKRTNPEDV